MDKELTKKSKYISKLLRHEPEDLAVDKNGWVQVSALLKKVGISKSELNQVVEENNKKRFEFDTHEIRIRARQGHSMEVDVQLTEVEAPDELFHGTAVDTSEIIMKEGISKMSRLHVHLSKDEDTAKNVGSRKGKSVILVINTKQMTLDGYKFYISNNGVYLTEFVPPKYIKNILY
jgi:putative RNA 2'-phosphotransferase